MRQFWQRYSTWTWLSTLGPGSVVGLTCVALQGQERLCVSGGGGGRGGCLWGSYRRDPLQPGGGILLLEPGSHLESGTLSAFIRVCLKTSKLWIIRLGLPLFYIAI